MKTMQIKSVQIVYSPTNFLVYSEKLIGHGVDSNKDIRVPFTIFEQLRGLGYIPNKSLRSAVLSKMRLDETTDELRESLRIWSDFLS